MVEKKEWKRRSDEMRGEKKEKRRKISSYYRV